MNRNVRYAAFIFVSAVSAAQAFAADMDAVRDGDDSTERAPGEGVPGQVPNCNPNASNCNTNSLQTSPTNQTTRDNPNNVGVSPDKLSPAINADGTGSQLSPAIDAKGTQAGDGNESNARRRGAMGPTRNGNSSSGGTTSSGGATNGSGAGAGGGAGR